MSEAAGSSVLTYGVEPSRRGCGFLAVGGTFLYPGIGHFIAGHKRRGAAWLIGDLSLTSLEFGLIVNGLALAGLCAAGLGTLLGICAAIDAYFAGRRARRIEFSSAWASYAVGLFLILAGCFRMSVENSVLGSVEHQHVVTYIVRTNPMSPTISSGDCVVVALGVQPKRWDIVSLHVPSASIPGSHVSIQRVVGMPGNTVEVTNSGLFIDGKRVALPPNLTPYAQPRSGLGGNGCQGNPIHLGPDEYFILGDNTAIANDSRHWHDSASGHQLGALPADDLTGVVQAVYWPARRFRIFAWYR